MTEPDPTPDTDDAGSESFELSPADLTGTVREMQAALRERYGATEATIQTDEPDRTQAPEDEFALTKPPKSEVTYRLAWLADAGDLPAEPGKGPTASALTLVEQKVERVTSDFPNAEVSCFAGPDHAQVNVTLGRQA